MMNKRKSDLWRRCSLCVIIASIFILALTACANENEEPLRVTENMTTKTIVIRTMYSELQFPEELYEYLHHVEAVEGKIAMEVFYMVSEQGEKELYRIYYADAKMGTQMGYWTVDDNQIPITYTVCEYDDVAFASEEERKLYHSMMDAFSVIINSIHSDEQFSETRAEIPVDQQTVKLRYWDLMLPSNIQHIESEEDGNYRVVFYGEVSGERINLYMIGLGDIEAESMLGMYTVNGVKWPVKVETFNLDAYSAWSEENQREINRMMSSINDVLQQIMSSEFYSEN